MLRLGSPSFGVGREGGGEEPCPLPGSRLSPLTVPGLTGRGHGGVAPVTARDRGACSSLGVPVMGVRLSRLCELKTSRDLFVSFIFVYVVAKCYYSVCLFT